MGKKNKKQKEEVMEEAEEGCCDGTCGCGCNCDEESEVPFLERHYYTKTEKIEMLEDYLADLKAEIEGVEEALVELRK